MSAPGRPRNRARTVVCVLMVLGFVGLLTAKLVLESRQTVLLAGDSILRQTGPALDDSFGWRYEIENKALNNSGLLTPGFVDWVDRLDRLVQEEHPDKVVLLFIGNYTDTDYWVDSDGNPVMKNTPEFFQAWGEQADRMMQVLDGSGTEVYWVLPPPEYTEVNQITTEGLRREYEALAQRWPGVHLIDANDALAGPDGEYLPTITNRHGEVVPLRVPDTVHLTEAGQRRLARSIHRALVGD